MHVDLFLKYERRSTIRVGKCVWSDTRLEYEIGDRIGAGGNAVVHECVDRVHGQSFAIKFQLALQRNRKQRFMREIKLLREISHEQLMSYVDQGSVDGLFIYNGKKVSVPFVVMPLAEKNLSETIRDGRKLPSFDEYIAQFRGLADALGVLHTKAVHRDIKPENILVRGETWLLSDFGLCKYFEQDGCDITYNEEILGPRYWMSPEAINKILGNDDIISKKSDVFQLSAVFWYVVTGRNPCGNVAETDWLGPKALFPVMADALSHNENRRPADGCELATRISDTLFS